MSVIHKAASERRTPTRPLCSGAKSAWPKQAGDSVECADGDTEAGGGGSHPGEKDGPGPDGQRSEHQHVAAVGKDGVPAKHGEEADGEHGGGEEEVLEGAEQRLGQPSACAYEEHGN